MIKNVVLVSFISLLFFGCEVKEPSLPYLGKYDVLYRKGGNDTIYQKIPDFSFLNQDSLTVTRKAYQGKIWVAEFFFTSCPTICPIMAKQLLRCYHAFPPKVHEDLQFLSFSIDPSNDSPSKLRKYREIYHLPSKNWDLLTGNEAETHRLGIDYFMVFAGKDALSSGGYAHSGAFTLVDGQGYVRGVYPVTNFDMSVNEQEFARMVKEIKILHNEHLNSR